MAVNKTVCMCLYNQQDTLEYICTRY